MGLFNRIIFGFFYSSVLWVFEVFFFFFSREFHFHVCLVNMELVFVLEDGLSRVLNYLFITFFC